MNHALLFGVIMNLGDRIQAVRIFVALAAISVMIYSFTQPVYAHFFGGTTVSIGDGYQVTFVPHPSMPVAGDNSTLNFSVLQNNSDIYSVFVSVRISGQSGNASIPYKQHEYSDVSIPLKFNQTGNYKITIYTLISNSKYSTTPLQATFDLQVISQAQAMLYDPKVLFVIIAVPVIGIAAAVSIHFWKRR